MSLFMTILFWWIWTGLDWIILSFRNPFLSFYFYLLLIWLFMFILNFFMLLSNDRTSRFLRVCAHKHLPMCRGTTFLHIHRSPPYTFAQITPLNPIFMGHCFNLCWHLLSHSNNFDQSNRILLPKHKGDNSGHVIIKMKQNSNWKLQFMWSKV